MTSSRGALLAAILLVTPAVVSAQAWTPPSGEGTLWFSGQLLRVDAHLQGNGVLARDVEVHSKSATLGVDYGLTDRLALAINLPYENTRLVRGSQHGAPPSMADDGRSHGTLTDLSLDLRYKAIDSAVVVTPLISVLVPERDYETRGHAAPGRGMKEYAAGFALGHNALWISPALFFSGGYRYTYVERIDKDITVDRSNADVELDYLLTSRLGLRTSGVWQKTHGGLDLPLAAELRAQHGFNHDQLARANYWRGSVGVSYGLTSKVDLQVSWSTVLRGVNTHQFRAWNGGVAWRFEGKRAHSWVSSSEPGKLSER